MDELSTAIKAVESGADRLELCGPGEGGLTPSEALLAEVSSSVKVPIHMMIRPREGDFVYSPDEFAQMMRAIELAKSHRGEHSEQHGQAVSGRVEAVVLGVLTPQKKLDLPRMRDLTAAARPLRVTCHRAFDSTVDSVEALDQLTELGVDSVLTSGQRETALEGVEVLRSLQERAAGAITILAGGGVRAHNVAEIIAATGVVEVHARASDTRAFYELVRRTRSIT